MYYQDAEILTSNAVGRRLYLSSEFNPDSGRHLLERHLSIGQKGKLQPLNALRIIDSEVYNDNDENIAMTKAEFAANVGARAGKFADFNFQPFSGLFEVIGAIISRSHKVDILADGFEDFLKNLDDLEKSAK